MGPYLKNWVFETGWSSDFRPDGTREEKKETGGGYNPFQVATFPELTEPPDYFLKEAMQDTQMNFMELDSYIRDLRQSGFDTVKLQVEFYRKFSVPLFALIMALIAAPFGFMVGRRGAMTGIGVAIVIAIAYWARKLAFRQSRRRESASATMAAWSPDLVFAMAGLYLGLRVKS